MCVYECTCVYLCICALGMCVCGFVCVHVCIRMCVCVVYVCMYKWTVNTYACINVYMHVILDVCMHVSVCVAGVCVDRLNKGILDEQTTDQKMCSSQFSGMETVWRFYLEDTLKVAEQ